MEYKPVRTKSNFVTRYAAGEFGNAAPTWNNPSEVDYNGLVHIRNRVAGAKTWYNVHSENLAYFWNDLIEVGYDPKQLYISAMAPTEKTLFQGEVMRWYHGLYLYYTTVAKPMREAFAICAKEAEGILAASLIKHYLDVNSQEWLEHLLDAYPDHVIEFSTYSTKWGTVPGFNTVFWETRLY